MAIFNSKPLNYRRLSPSGASPSVSGASPRGVWLQMQRLGPPRRFPQVSASFLGNSNKEITRRTRRLLDVKNQWLFDAAWKEIWSCWTWISYMILLHLNHINHINHIPVLSQFFPLFFIYFLRLRNEFHRVFRWKTSLRTSGLPGSTNHQTAPHRRCEDAACDQPEGPGVTTAFCPKRQHEKDELVEDDTMMTYHIMQ